MNNIMIFLYYDIKMGELKWGIEQRGKNERLNIEAYG